MSATARQVLKGPPTVRMLIVRNIVSLDGFSDYDAERSLRAADTLLLGRRPGPLRLLDTRTLEGSSLLLARYAVER